MLVPVSIFASAGTGCGDGDLVKVKLVKLARVLAWRIRQLDTSARPKVEGEWDSAEMFAVRLVSSTQALGASVSKAYPKA